MPTEYHYPLIANLASRFERLYKQFDWVVLGLLAVIILLPKFQLIQVPGTYINIRSEDFLIAIVYGLWLIGWLGGRFQFSSVFNYRAIVGFLIYGLVITIAGIYLFKTVEEPHLGILHWLRRVEYLGMYFITATVAKKENLHRYLYVMIMIGAVTWIYGYLQWLDILPGVHTLSKSGQVGTFSELGYVISTFAAHYDFGAFLMLMIMLCVWGYYSHKSWPKRIVFVIAAFAFWWMSRLVYGRAAYLGTLVGLAVIFVIKMSGWALFPVGELFMTFDRYFSGQFSKYAYNFKFNILPQAPTPIPPAVGDPVPTTSLGFGELIEVPNPQDVFDVVVDETKDLTAEDIPEPSQIRVFLDQFVDVWSPRLRSLLSRLDINLDPSANIRLEEWQNALARVGYHFMWGAGYASMNGVGLDNEYLRKIIEVGVFGLAVFLMIILDFFRVIWKSYTSVTIVYQKYFHFAMLGFMIGMLIEALFIDIFESSKIAFTFWFLMGLVALFEVPVEDLPSKKEAEQVSPASVTNK